MDVSNKAFSVIECGPAVLDAGDLEQRLQGLSSRSTSPDWEQYRLDFHRDETFAYNCLELEGGIPSHSLEIFDEAAKAVNHPSPIVRYWARQTRRSTDLYICQLQYWRDFRDYQKNAREYFFPGPRFVKYQPKMNHYRQSQGLSTYTVPELERDICAQSRLATWLEFQDWNLQQLIALQRKLAAQQARLQKSLQARKEAALPHYEFRPPGDGFNYDLDEIPHFEYDIERASTVVREIESEVESAVNEIHCIKEGKGPRAAFNPQLRLRKLSTQERKSRSYLQTAKRKLLNFELKKEVVNDTIDVEETRIKLRERTVLCNWIEEQRLRLRQDEEKSKARTRVIFSQHVFPLPGAGPQSLDEEAVTAASLEVLREKTIAEIEGRNNAQAAPASLSAIANDAPDPNSREGESRIMDAARSRSPSSPRQKRSSPQPCDEQYAARFKSIAEAQTRGEGQHAPKNRNDNPAQAPTAQKTVTRQRSQFALATQTSSKSAKPRGRPRKPRASKKTHATPLARAGSPPKCSERRRALSSSRPDPPAGIRRSTRKCRKPDFFRPG